MVSQKKASPKKSQPSKTSNGEITMGWIDDINRRIKNIETAIIDCQGKIMKVMGRMGL
jgi:hypothetical protein